MPLPPCEAFKPFRYRHSQPSPSVDSACSKRRSWSTLEQEALRDMHTAGDIPCGTSLNTTTEYSHYPPLDIDSERTALSMAKFLTWVDLNSTMVRMFDMSTAISLKSSEDLGSSREPLNHITLAVPKIYARRCRDHARKHQEHNASGLAAASDCHY